MFGDCDFIEPAFLFSLQNGFSLIRKIFFLCFLQNSFQSN